MQIVEVASIQPKAPSGDYFVWNIGAHAPKGYVPFCRIKAGPYEWSREVDTDSLIAVPSEGADVIMAAVGFGPDTSKGMREFIAEGEKHPVSNTGKYAKWILNRMRKAIPYLEAMGR